MYSVAKNVTSVKGIIFGKDNSGLVCIEVTPSHQETTKKGYFPKKSIYCSN